MVAIYIAPNYISIRYWGHFLSTRYLILQQPCPPYDNSLLHRKILNNEKSYLGAYIYTMFCGIKIVCLDDSCM